MNGATNGPDVDQLLAISRDDGATLDERLDAIEQLGERGNGRVASHLGDLLESDRPQIRKQAAIALGSLKHPDALPDLCDALDDPDVQVRQQAAIALGRMQQPEAVSRLGQVLAQDEAVEVREQAALALGDIGGPESVEKLGQALRDENQETSVREQAADALGMIGGAEGVKKLVASLEDRGIDLGLRRHVATVLATMADPQAPYTLVSSLDENRDDALEILDAFGDEMLGLFIRTLLQSDREQVRMSVRDVLSELDRTRTIDALSRILADPDNPLRWNAINLLGEIGGQEVILDLGYSLLNDQDTVARTSAATALGKIDLAGAREYLWRALLEVKEQDVRKATETALTKTGDWETKIAELIRILEEGTHRHQDIDALALFQAIQPHEKDRQPKREDLVYYLFDQSLSFNQDNRMTAILAEIVIACVGKDRDEAGEHLNKYQEAKDRSDEDLQMLRTYIGGEAAIGPIQRALKADLKQYFQEPIKDLNQATRVTWATTIRYAQYGFLARMAMSVILFGIGVYLVLDTYLEIKAGNFEMEQVLGPAVSFLSGMTAMLFSIYRGPLKDIRQSVNDLGIASAAFMAYIHRILEISHTFSFYYLEQKITFEEMKKSSLLIQDAMKNTIEMLSPKSEKTGDDAAQNIADNIADNIVKRRQG